MLYRTRNGIVSEGTRYNFSGVGEKDVYNPIAPFIIGNKRVLAARLKSRSSKTDTQVMFFERDGPLSWRPVDGAPVFKLQDPFHSRIKNIHIIGGVETFTNPEGTGLSYRTVFYKGRDLNSLQRFAVGPNGMKDIRLAALSDGRIAVFTRPQGEISATEFNANPGKIGFTIIKKLSELTPDKIANASLINGLFANGRVGRG